MKHLVAILLMAILGLSGFAGYRLLRSDIEAAVYRSRLEEVAHDYELLRESYNEAIRRTAVTELRVEQGVLSVAIRDALGDVRVTSPETTDLGTLTMLPGSGIMGRVISR